MILITFSKAGRDDIVLTEDDLFDFQYEASCFSSDTFELGGINARKLYLLIDNNTQRFPRGARITHFRRRSGQCMRSAFTKPDLLMRCHLIM